MFRNAVISIISSACIVQALPFGPIGIFVCALCLVFGIFEKLNEADRRHARLAANLGEAQTSIEELRQDLAAERKLKRWGIH